MYQNILSKLKMQNRRKLLALSLSLVVLASIAGVTIAYLTEVTGETNNTFAPSSISCTVNEVVDGNLKKEVTVTNTGKTTAYIRVAVIANSVREDGNVTGSVSIDDYLNIGADSDWVKVDNYYYYKKQVAPQEDPANPAATTANLIGSYAIDLTDRQVVILAEAIQAEPASAAKDRWGVDPENGFAKKGE